MFDFTGRYDHALDAKGRLSLPAPFRGQLDGSQPGKVALSFDRKCLVIFPPPVWHNLLERMRSLSSTSPQATMFKRVIFSTAFACDLDRQGRVLVPASLRELLAIGREVAVIGQGDRIEIWDQARWKATFTDGLEQLEPIATNLQL